MGLASSWRDLGYAALAGAVLWEVAKQCFSGLLKRRADRRERKRDLLRIDVTKAADLVDACLEQSVTYFTNAQDTKLRADLGKSLIHKVKLLSTSLQAINLGIDINKASQLDQSLVIIFRKAVTTDIGSAGYLAESTESPRVTAMYRAAHHLQMALRRLKYDVT